MSMKADESGDCLSCKLISFTGLTASGAYVAYYAQRQPTVLGKTVLGTCAVGLAYLGVARLVKIYPFTMKRGDSPNVMNGGGKK